MSGPRFVHVSCVPTSASPGELSDLFGQAGEVQQVLCQYEAGAAEGTALVAFASSAAAQQAADLLDGYPLGMSLLEVQAVGPDQFVGRTVSRLLTASGQRQQQAQAPPLPLLPQLQPQLPQPQQQQRPAPLPAPAPPPAAHDGGRFAALSSGGGVVEALEAEMRELQLSLQAQADTIQETAAAAVAERQQQQALQRQQYEERQRQEQLQGWGEDEAYTYDYGSEAGGEEGWQAPRVRRPHAQQQHAQEQWPRDIRAGGGSTGSGGGAGSGGGGQYEEPNTGLWIGWIDLKVEAADLARAFSRWGPVHVEHLTAADRPADDGRRYKWGIVRYHNINHAIAAKEATNRRPLPPVSSSPGGLKVVYYTAGHSGATRKR